MSKKNLILFDFDGTITSKDTLIYFIIFSHGYLRFLLGFCVLSPIIILFKLGLIKNHQAKEIVLQYFFKNTPLTTFNSQCIAFAKTKIPTMIRPKALHAIRQYQSQGNTVVVVSASLENWVKPWCDQHQLDCLATRPEVVDDKLTGKMSGRNCYGSEKASRVASTYTLEEYQEIIAYGDSAGDKEMLGMAHHSYFNYF